MPSASNVARQLTARIAASNHSLTIVFPPARTAQDGVSPGPAPLNPFLGAPPAPKRIAPDTATPEAQPKTIKCLWIDSVSATSVFSARSTITQLGWHADSDAMARVLMTDVATTAGKTLLDACDHVEHDGRHYAVLNVVPIGAGFDQPVSCAVWLKTLRSQ